MDRIEISAPAKINLFLKVLGKRNDGFHNIFSWFQAVSLLDQLTFEKSNNIGFRLTIEGSADLPVNDDNLIVRSARLLFEKHKMAGGLKMNLKKSIPVAAGLAGGSSDSAATIYAINKLFELGLSNDEMSQIGLQIGSDIPFFFSSGQAEVTGRGEKIKNIVLPLDYHIILICPSLAVSTAGSYRQLKINLTIPAPNIKFSNCNSFKELLVEIGDIGNDFERLHLETYPVLGRIRDVLNRAGALLTRMSGSGPTVFGLFDNMPEREDLLQITRGDWQVMIVRPITLPAWDYRQ
jgi:4-diphosphocytidyl-2-C-methyl-D-erythritol kinase